MGASERRIEIMRYLCRERYSTMRKMAERFGVSVRTIRRDIFELTPIMPIYVRSGRYDGGVYVIDGYSMGRAYMSRGDIELLRKIERFGEGDCLDEDDKIRLKNIIRTFADDGIKL